jgi:hypothetical protein
LMPLKLTPLSRGFFISNFYEKLIKYFHRKDAKVAEN